MKMVKVMLSSLALLYLQLCHNNTLMNTWMHTSFISRWKEEVLHMPANLCCSLSFSPHTPQQFQDTATIIHGNLKAYCPFLFHSGVLMTSVADLNRFLQRSQTLLPSLLIMIFLRQSIFIRYLTVGERIICRGSQPFATPKKSLNLRPSEELDLLTKWIGGGNNFSML